MSISHGLLLGLFRSAQLPIHLHYLPSAVVAAKSAGAMREHDMLALGTEQGILFFQREMRRSPLPLARRSFLGRCSHLLYWLVV